MCVDRISILLAGVGCPLVAYSVFSSVMLCWYCCVLCLRDGAFVCEVVPPGVVLLG